MRGDMSRRDYNKLFAGDTLAKMLSTGDFAGLGKSANYLVQVAGQEADADAKEITPHTTRTSDKYLELRDKLSRQFTIDVLGFGSEKITIMDAAYRLVDAVFDQYLEWACEGQEIAEREESFRQAIREL